MWHGQTRHTSTMSAPPHHHTGTQAVTMLLHSEHACGSSARRRRERRLRSWATHERMSIAIVVAENLQHSRQKVEGNTSKGLLAQKSAVAPILKDPEVQWLKERSLFVSAGCPSLAVSPLTEHERLLAQSLAPRAQELSNVESMVSTSSHLVPESVGNSSWAHQKSARSGFPCLFLVLLVLRPCWWKIRCLSRSFLDSPLCLRFFMCRSKVRSPYHRSPSRPNRLWTILLQR